MDSFTPVSATLGGLMIGTAAALLFWFNGRIAGITGIVGGLLPPATDDRGWRLAFVAGLLAGGLGLALVYPEATDSLAGASPAWVVVAGLLVGYGTRLGNGCTSGHGVCGIPRGSTRSIVATITFIGVGMLTVAVVNALGGPA